MASSSITILFLLLSLTTLQIHARDSHFFSKVTTETPAQTVLIPDKSQEQQSLVTKQKTEPTQQPEFLPQSESGYGLYGHETGLNPPESDVVSETTTTYGTEKYYNNDKNDAFTTSQKDETSPFKTDKDDLLNFDDAFDGGKFGNKETFYSNNQNGVGTEHYTAESLQNTRIDNDGDESYYNYNTDKSGRFGSQLGQRDTETYYPDNRFDNRFTDELKSRYRAYRGESSAGERKGMSDTRFLENGKYYYDLEKEQNQYDNTYKNNKYSNSKYDGASYDNSGAEKYEFNTMEEYENSRLNNQYDP